MTTMKVSDFIAEFLRVQKTTHVFEVAGGMITHLLDSLYRLGNTSIISVHHEQAAAFAVDAYGRITGRPGVALATSGPGATNLLTGIASCYFDSSPGIFITGQVNTHEQKGSKSIRQLGFQETDIISMAKPITKKCYRVDRAEQVESVMYEAFSTAINGRPGPVLIDLPMNIQRAQILTSTIKYIEKSHQTSQPMRDSIKELLDAIKKAKRPLILAGQGVSCSRATKEFLQFVDELKIPVVTSLLALDLIPYDHPFRCGFIGTYGNRWANIALGTSDVLIVLGSRLDIRQTGADIDGFRNDKKIYHIDCDESEINNRIKGCIPIVSDIKSFFEEFSAIISMDNFTASYELWLSEINQLKNKWPDLNELKNVKGINPNNFMHQLAVASKQAISFIADVGNHQMWAAQSLEILSGQTFITSGGMGAMGFALPAAVGISLAVGKSPVVVIVGDGAFQFNIQELQTIVRNRLPIKIVVINNQALGMIRQFQDSYFEGRYQSTYWGYSAPDFAAIASAYGISSKTISCTNEIQENLGWLWNKADEASLLQVMIDSHVNVYPKIAFGKPITEMEPMAAPIEMEST